MSQCKGYKKNGEQCTRKVKSDYCFQHGPKLETTADKFADAKLFETDDLSVWEQAYQTYMDPKYRKQSKKFNQILHGTKWIKSDQPPIYVVPRVRTESYKQVKLEGVDNADVYYAPISKGFCLQDVSSFVMGPIVGQGLCLVNMAFSKEITVAHIEGHGKFNLKRKNFWQAARHPKYEIQVLNDERMMVDGQEFSIVSWLEQKKQEWYPEWLKFSRAVALCGKGQFHWNNGSPTVLYYHDARYLKFVEWKKQIYIAEAYKLLPDIPAFQWLKKVWLDHRRVLGLVHPKGKSGSAELPITREYIRDLYDSETEMSCMPYVVAGKLLDVSIDII